MTVPWGKMKRGKTYPCGIYEDAPLNSSEVILFFEIQIAEDDYRMLGAARFSRMRKGWMKRPPLEACHIDNWKREFQDAWEVVYSNTPDEYNYRAEFTDEGIKIYNQDDSLWLTLI